MAMGVYPQAQGVPEHLHSQLLGSHSAVSIDYIEAAERERDIDEKAVALLMDSIEATGLQQPIGVRRINGAESKRLIWGRQRLEAYRRKWQAAADAGDEKGMGRWGRIPAIVYPAEMTDALASLLEVQENLDRGDLTADQRRQWSARKLKLQAQVQPAQGEGPKVKQGTNGTTWYPPTREEAAATAGVPMRTFQKWYAAYKAEHHGKDWNRQVQGEYEDFLQWLETSSARKAAVDARKAEQARLKNLETCVAALKKSITDSAKKHGPEIYTVILAWLGARAEAN